MWQQITCPLTPAPSIADKAAASPKNPHHQHGRQQCVVLSPLLAEENVQVYSLSIPVLCTVVVVLPKLQTCAFFLPTSFFAFLRGPLKIGGTEASLFNLNTLQQNRGNCPHWPSAPWQVSMCQRERWRLTCPPFGCHDNSQAESFCWCVCGGLLRCPTESLTLNSRPLPQPLVWVWSPEHNVYQGDKILTCSMREKKEGKFYLWSPYYVPGQELCHIIFLLKIATSLRASGLLANSLCLSR